MRINPHLHLRPALRDSVNKNKNSMYDVITFGAGAQDIYIKSKQFLPVSGKAFSTGQGICLALGSKTEVEDIFLSSGGGGTNTAATFANQGLKTAYCGMLGDDCFGNLIIAELKNLKIDTQFILKTKNKLTNTSVFLTYPGKDRTIMVYRGASDDLEKKDIPWREIKSTKWFYLAPFSGKLADLTEDLISFAQKNKIKVAWNPGYNQLKFSKKTLERILRKIDVLLLNKEEASLLTKIFYQKEKEVFQKIDKMTKGIAIMTKGGEGVSVSDGKYLYRAGSLGLKMVDGTGAGDAFGSGFVAGLIQKVKEDKSSFSPSVNNVTFAIQLAMANSSYNITKWGAKEGLLKKSQKWQKTKVIKELCSNGLCQVK
jgi:sugar/nucleoside kinase (ribokinase family)